MDVAATVHSLRTPGSEPCRDPSKSAVCLMRSASPTPLRLQSISLELAPATVTPWPCGHCLDLDRSCGCQAAIVVCRSLVNTWSVGCQAAILLLDSAPRSSIQARV